MILSTRWPCNKLSCLLLVGFTFRPYGQDEKGIQRSEKAQCSEEEERETEEEEEEDGARRRVLTSEEERQREIQWKREFTGAPQSSLYINGRGPCSEELVG